jgi:hypothetical protein
MSGIAEGHGLPPAPGSGVNPDPPPHRSAERTVAVPLIYIADAKDALHAALILSTSLDAQAAAQAGARAPTPSALSQQLDKALRGLNAASGGVAPPERSDLHLYTAEQLTPEFVRDLMLERGWVSGELHVGSSQVETMARRVLHSGLEGTTSIRLVPAGAHGRVQTPDGWTLTSG